MLGDDVALETGDFLTDVLAAYPAVEDRYLVSGKPVLQLLLETARIAHHRGARADALRRGGAYRDNGQRLGLLNPRGGALENHINGRERRWRSAAGRAGASRRLLGYSPI